MYHPFHPLGIDFFSGWGTFVIGMTQIALETTLTEEQQDCLQTIASSAETLLGILNDILDLSK